MHASCCGFYSYRGLWSQTSFAARIPRYADLIITGRAQKHVLVEKPGLWFKDSDIYYFGGIIEAAAKFRFEIKLGVDKGSG